MQETSVQTISQLELDEIIEKHKLFIGGHRGGARAVLKFMDLSGLDFRKAHLRDADFTGSKLNNSNLSGTDCTGASFFGCDMRRTNMQKANFTRSDFRGAHVIGADLSDTDFTNADLRQGVIFNYDSTGNVTVSDWQNKGNTVMSGSIIRNTDMTNAMAQGANFSDANLSGVVIRNANLRDSDMKGANLSGADFSGANMAGVRCADAILEDAIFVNTEAGGSDLRKEVAKQNRKKSLLEDGLTLTDLLQSHMQWVETAGMAGEQLKLEEYDLSDENAFKAEKLTAVIAKRCKFTGLNMEGAMMQASYLDETDFADCNMRSTDFRGSSCTGSIFTRANLINSNFSALVFKKPDGSEILQKSNLSNARMAYVDMDNANFSNVILKNANLSHASLKNCNLQNADLSGADLSNADLTDADLTDANLEDAIMEGTK